MSRIVSNARALLRALTLLVWVLFSLGFVVVAYLLRWDHIRAWMVKCYYRVCCFIFGLRLHVEGDVAPDRPLLLVANHTTYLDILVLGSLTALAFTPKSEIRDWPIIGFLCILADCVFIERRAAYMQHAAAEMRAKLKRGKVLCIFGEGTTTDGIHLKPFKSGFFSLAIEEHLAVQPVSIAYTHLGRRPIAPDKREEVAWVGEATLVDHLWHILSVPNVRIYVRLHPAIPADSFTDRKLLAQACEHSVKAGVGELMGMCGETYVT